MTAISDTKNGGTLSTFAYTYDAAGNPTQVVTGNTTIAYGYDKNQRLTSACYGSSCTGGSISYTYDGDGNRTKFVDSSGTTSYSYDNADELTSTSGASNTSYRYDNDGRRISAGSASYTWNAADELTKLTLGSTTTTYSYDGDGKRASTTSGGQTTRFVYDTNNQIPLLALEQQSSSTLRRYVWGAGLVSMNAGGSDYYAAHDAQNSIVALTSSNGTTEATYSYDAFGNQVSANGIPGAPGLPLRYDSQYLDQTGLYHLQARQYEPATGAFISQDPLVATNTAPAMSPYIYADDRPTTLQDPTGQTSSGYGSYQRNLSACANAANSDNAAAIINGIGACGAAGNAQAGAYQQSVNNYRTDSQVLNIVMPGEGRVLAGAAEGEAQNLVEQGVQRATGETDQSLYSLY